MTWTEERLLSTLASLQIRGGDSTDIELKRAATDFPSSIAETICSFANMPDGGTIILGVDEKNNFEITGVYSVSELEASIASTVRNSIIPPPHLEFKSLFISDKPLLVVTVTGLSITERPARFKGKAYLRQSDGDYVMNDFELKQLEVAKLHAEQQVFYDEEVISGTSTDDLDRDLLTQYLGNMRASSRRLSNLSDDEILRTTRVTKNGELTLAGLYALGKYPQGFEPALGATAAVQLARESGGRTVDLRHFDGPLPEILADALSWVANNLPTVQTYATDGNLQNVPAAPLTAVRELLANALVHRDLGPYTLGTGKSIQIRINEKGLFIENPGGLRGISVEQLTSQEHAQAAVNQRLYNIAKHLRTSQGARVIEGEGGGIREVLTSVQEYGLVEPLLINSGVKFKAIIWFAKQDSSQPTQPLPSTPVPAPARDWSTLGKNVPTLVALLSQVGPLPISELASRTGLSLAQVRYALAPLLQGEHVEMVGEQGRKNTFYRMASQ